MHSRENVILYENLSGCKKKCKSCLVWHWRDNVILDVNLNGSKKEEERDVNPSVLTLKHQLIKEFLWFRVNYMYQSKSHLLYLLIFTYFMWDKTLMTKHTSYLAFIQFFRFIHHSIFNFLDNFVLDGIIYEQCNLNYAYQCGN